MGHSLKPWDIDAQMWTRELFVHENYIRQVHATCCQKKSDEDQAHPGNARESKL